MFEPFLKNAIRRDNGNVESSGIASVTDVFC